MIRISVFIPARGRPEYLTESVRRLIELAAKPDEIEILVRTNVDDESLASWSYPGVRVIRGLNHGYHDLQVYLNEIAERAVGEWFFFMNDDAYMETQGWDALIPEHKPLRYLSGEAVEGIGQGWGIFPIVSRDVYEVLGTVSRYHGWDSYFARVFGHLGQPPQKIPIRISHWDKKLRDEGNEHTLKVQEIRAAEFDAVNQHHFFEALDRLAQRDAEKLRRFANERGILWD